MRTLRWLLFGGSEKYRPGLKQETHAALDACINGIIELLPRVYGDTMATQLAQLELRRVIAMRCNFGVSCKRAMLLFALSRERELRDFWKDAESRALADDLIDRVLPLIAPRFLSGSAQRPAEFTALALVLVDLWPTEKLCH